MMTVLLISMGLIFMAVGLYGTYKYKNFYTRILISAKIDIIGDITILIGLMFKHGISFFTMKLILIFFIILIINPLTTHIIVRSAYQSGYKVRKDLI
ncbi:MAG: monovalent cation/H(+) antiporter subunit G [Clostridia bacterium]|nr:monovalent cation/H(+) antiporter subunit G [Clostridia bacterium]